MLKFPYFDNQLFDYFFVFPGKHHTSHITHHTSHIKHQTSNIKHHTSHITYHTSNITHHISHITHQTSHIKHQTSNIKHHTSNITHQTSNIKHHTSNIKHHLFSFPALRRMNHLPLLNYIIATLFSIWFHLRGCLKSTHFYPLINCINVMLLVTKSPWPP
jgi:hypothetical protein